MERIFYKIKNTVGKSKALMIVLVFLIISLSWIFLTEWLVDKIDFNIINRSTFSLIKGSFYVILAAVFLYELVKKSFVSFEKEKAIALEHENLYKLIAENTDDVIWRLNILTGKFIYISPSIRKLTGFTPEEIYNQSPEITLTKKYVELYTIEFPKRNFRDEHSDNYKTKAFETEQFCKDGSTVMTEIVSTLITNEYGVVNEIVGVTRNITERKKVENLLKESVDKYRNLVEYSIEGIGIAKGNKIVYGNKALLDIFGYDSFIEFTRIPLINHVAPDSKNLIAEILGRNDRIAGDSSTYEIKIKRKDGSIRVVEIASTLMNIDNENYTQSTFRDITDKKQAEEALKESEIRYRTLVETADDAIILSDLNGNSLFRNNGYYKNLGLKSEDYPNHDIHSTIHPDDEQNIRSGNEELFKNGFQKGEYRVLHKLGHWVYRSARSVLVYDDQNKPKYILSIARDISERKRFEFELELHKNHLEEQIKTRTDELDHANKILKNEFEKEKEYELMLQKSLEREKELNELKSRFISTASHEFRTPLTSVMSSAELIQRYGEKWSVEKRNTHLNRIKNSVDYLTKLLDEVLTISRAETGKILFNPNEMDLYSHCLEIIQEAKLYCNDKHNFVFEYTLEKNKYKLDGKLIKFIILNLLSNAFKYSPEGGEVKLEITGDEQYITFLVKDNGIGIPETDRIHLFEPFHRGKNIDEIQGTGLGLSIVQKSVEIHEGSISFSSINGVGTTFIVKIPVGEIGEQKKDTIY